MEHTADGEAVARDDLGELAKVLEVLSAAVSNVDLDTDLERALAQDVMWVVSQHPEGVMLSTVKDMATEFFGHSTKFSMTLKERGRLLKVLIELRKAGLITKSENIRRYKPTATGWLKVQEADNGDQDEPDYDDAAGA